VWADDAMNRDPRFLRTRIRHEILPLLEAHFQPSPRPSLVARLCRSADLVRAAVADLERRAAEVLDGAARSTAAGVVLPLAALAAVSPGLAAEVVRLAAVRGGAASGLRGPSHRAIARAIDPAVTASRAGLGRLVVERSGSWLRVGPRRLAPLGEHAWPVPGSLDLAERGIRLEARVFSRPAGYTPPGGTRAVAFDAARMPSALIVRARRAGDRFAPFGAPGSRRLKAFLIAAGVPRWERDRLPLVVAGDDIAWVVGCRRGRVAPVTAETSRILELTVHGPVAGESLPE
ncbi:MAG TPA: tRNA lysidine(34) synthetase TilS, partial [Candidatus Binatia bacterium]|nr:tRNA lysidine(34) synthetase TilS [Candidatus Binatia bacterium]